jgi:protein-L-isoaspartate(D-aspartate) O-methyltransferase
LTGGRALQLLPRTSTISRCSSLALASGEPRAAGVAIWREPCDGAEQMSTDSELRRALVEIVRREVRAERVLEVMRRLPRHVFIPEFDLAQAYADHPLPIGWGATISQPTVVGMMSEALGLDGTERILEIGTGSGYQAAVLSRLARHVDSVEVVPDLAARARHALAELHIDNVDVHVGDGWEGLPLGAPFDRIVVTAAPDVVPRALVDQLAEGGFLVVPVGPQSGDQRLERHLKRNGRLVREDLGAVRFVPMVHDRRSAGSS